MSISTGSQHSPNLPKIFSAPLKLLPDKYHSIALSLLLNRILSQQIKDGELDFLTSRRVCIDVSDTNICYYIGFHNNKIIAEDASNNVDLSIQSNTYDFLTLASRQQDPDTLVFQRRLIMQGDTELGLELKNFLDGVDIRSDNRYKIIQSFLGKFLPAYKRLLG